MWTAVEYTRNVCTAVEYTRNVCTGSGVHTKRVYSAQKLVLMWPDEAGGALYMSGIIYLAPSLVAQATNVFRAYTSTGLLGGN